MKSIIAVLIVLLLIGCSTQKTLKPKPIYEILATKNDGGAKIEFYELLTEPNEIRMLLNDPDLKRKVNEKDLVNSNFVILNMGEMPLDQYMITVDKVEESDKEIVVYIKKIKPANVKPNPEEIYVSPFAIIKINSKKPIVFK